MRFVRLHACASRSQNLPDDIETLKRLVIEQQALIAASASQRLERQQAEELYLRTWIEKLKLEIARLKRMQFGRSSEKLDERIEQLELIVEDLETSQAQVSSPKAAVCREDPAGSQAAARAPAARDGEP